jgi:hypothetical protein
MAILKLRPMSRSGAALCLWLAYIYTSQATLAQQIAVTQSSIANDVLRNLQEGHVDKALDLLGTFVDQGVPDDTAASSGIPAAAAGIYRSLSQLSADEQYALLLKWSLPSADRNTVRLLATPVPVEAPPKAFARAIGERARDTTFAVSDVGGVRGLFCSGWMLVQAANDIGRLSLLIAELERLNNQQVVGAKELLLLAQIADRRNDANDVQAYLAKTLAAGMGDTAAAAQQNGSILIPVAIAAAALTKENLRPHSESALNSFAQRETALRPLIRVAHATAVQLNRGQSPADVLYENRLQHWVPVTGMTASLSRAGVPQAMWLTHEDHVLHLAGGSDDILFCRYPLTGEFDFICETQEGGVIRTDGGLVYGGLQFEALGSTEQLTIRDADGNHGLKIPCPFVRRESTATFNRVSIRGAKADMTFESNFHPVWFDGDAAAASPWVGLRSYGTNRPVFRNFRVEGKPVIPRQVVLLSGDQLRGWQSGFFAESQQPFSTARSPRETADGAEADWQMQSDILVARAVRDPTAAAQPGLLRYQRPLLEDETITYEFEHGSGDVPIHPAVGRMAFLLRPDGIHIRWITDARRDWTGLQSEHSLLEPLNRRGARSLPLKENQWNQIAVSRSGGKVNITINDQLVYQRPHDFDGATQLGLYRENRGGEVRIRKAVMTGDWPEQLPQDFLENPVTLQTSDAPPADHKAMCDLVGEETIASNIHAIRRSIAATAPTDRFEALCSWVLPNIYHSHPRMNGLFIPTQPSPDAREDTAFLHLVTTRKPQANELMSPVYDLFDAAAEGEKLALLRTRIESIDDHHDDYLARAKIALSALAECELGDEQSTEELLVRLRHMIDRTRSNTAQDHWLELVTAHRATERFPKNQVVGDLVALLYEKWVKNAGSSVDVALQCHLLKLASSHWIEQMSGSEVAMDDAGLPAGWLVASESNASTYGAGRTAARWMRNLQGEVVHLEGHEIDYLYFQSPLAGRFTIEADVTVHGSTQMFHGGEYCGPGSTLQTIDLGTFRQPKHSLKLERSFDKPQRWVRYRLDVADNISRVFLNGRMVRQRTLTPGDDPWFAFRGWWKSRGDFRDVSITGSPAIPDEVPLSQSNDLNGWISYERVAIGTADAHWRWEDDLTDAGAGVIVAKRRNNNPDSSCERLLQYHRPLFEDGEIELEFFYEPETALASAALGRLVLNVASDGVHEHWMTDGKHDATLIRPDNSRFEEQHQRGGGAPPLAAGDWNRLTVKVSNNSILLHLNDVLIYERLLAADHDRKFGLFHFADRHELRVRRLVMRGDWPKQIPTLQALADPLITSIDGTVEELPAVFKQDFRQHDQTDRYIRENSPPAGVTSSAVEGGKFVSVTSMGNWTQKELTPRFSLHGDFDVEASFTALVRDLSAKEYSANLTIRVADQYATKLVTTIGYRPEYGHFVRGQATLTRPDGTPSYLSTRIIDESSEGRLRVSRRGTKAYFLFAQGDSLRYQLIGQQETSMEDVPLGAVQLLTVAHGLGRTEVVWQDITLRAAAMTFLPPTEAVEIPKIAVMELGSGDVRAITGPTGRYSKVGSVAWSPDSKRLAYDQSAGSTRDSRVMIVDVETRSPTDLGYGSMPTFSADGKRVAFSAAGEGVGFMDVDGTNRRIIDQQGWGIQWSPNGRTLGYTIGGNIILWDVATETDRPLMVGQAATRYSFIYWNMGWSRDSTRIAFKGRRRDNQADECAVISLARPEHVQPLFSTQISPGSFSWSPEDEAILFAMMTPGVQIQQLYTVKPDGSQPPSLLSPQPKNCKGLSAAWSPDGKSLAITAVDLAVPVAWRKDTAGSL